MSKYKYEGYGVVRDTEIDFPYHTDDIVDLLDEKDQQITDLEAKLAESEKKAYSRGHSQRDIANEIKLNALREDVANKEKRIVELKQQLHDLPKKIVGEIKDISLDYWDFNTCEECGYIADLSTLTIKDFDEILDTTLEKFGVEDESNND